MAHHLLYFYAEVFMAGIYTVVSGATAEEKKLGFISNNLANALTTGYKSSRPIFEAVLASSVIETDQTDSTFVGTYDAHIDFAQGSLIESGNKLDLALQGDGFFVIETPQGDRYTRNGQFSLDSTGKLVTHDGQTVAGEGGDIVVNGKQISVEKDGSVFSDKVPVGKIKVVRFASNDDLRPIGSSLFENVNTADQELPAPNCTVNQGFHEASNVEALKEMIDMIACTRAYEAYGKVQQAFSDMESQLQQVAKV
jgi:flagellar basal-body rod protein FlgF